MTRVQPSTWRFARLGAATLAFLVVLAVVPARAQTRLYALFASPGCSPTVGCRPGALIDIDVERGRVRGIVPITPMGTLDPGVTPDGRYLVFSGYRSPGAHLDVLDTESYALSSFYVAAPGPGFGYAVHPTTTRAYFQRPEDERIFVVDGAGGVRQLSVPAGEPPGQLRRISGDGSRLFTFRHLENEVAAIDSTSGATIGVVSEAYDVLAVNADGTEIYAYGQPGIAVLLERRAVSGGALLARTTLARAGNVTRDPRTGHIWVAGDGVVRIFDGSTLTPLFEFPVASELRPVDVAFDPERPVAYLAWNGPWPAAVPVHLVALNTDTMAVEGEADITLPDMGLINGLVLAPRPPRVETLSALVSDSAVTLSWINASSQSLATHLIVEAGSAPGLSNLARFVVPPAQASFEVSSVPAGTYFVRVRPVNGTGAGTASNEITVVVP